MDAQNLFESMVTLAKVQRADVLTDQVTQLLDKTPGQLAYERDLAFKPNYDDGAPRIGWDQLPDYAKHSWEINPTDRFAPPTATPDFTDDPRNQDRCAAYFESAADAPGRGQQCGGRVVAGICQSCRSDYRDDWAADDAFEQQISAGDKLLSACRYLGDQFNPELPYSEITPNLDARTLLLEAHSALYPKAMAAKGGAE